MRKLSKRARALKREWIEVDTIQLMKPLRF